MALTFLQLAQRVIEEEKRPLSANEIWQQALEKGYDKELATKGKTPWATLGAQLYVDVRDNPNSVFQTIGSRPKQFRLRAPASPDVAIPLPVVASAKPEYLERDLHSFVAYYAYYYLRAFTKTIRHTKSAKKEFGEWLHPDMVGCYFHFGDWIDEVVSVSTLLGHTPLRFFSFELKRELSFANLREAFFQTVSNSSWANEGYLVAAEVDTDDEFYAELKRLSSSFGIGVIRIDVTDPDSTAILLPARSRDVVDWETANKLASANQDFREFLKRVGNDVKNKEIIREKYDPVLDREQLLLTLASKR